MASARSDDEAEQVALQGNGRLEVRAEAEEASQRASAAADRASRVAGASAT